MMTISQEELQRMEEAARRAASRSYSPYSRFAVGAAVLTASGGVFAGCNVENASLGLTVCAERHAVAAAVAAGERELRAVLVYAPTPRPTLPCGACRQVLREFASDLPVYAVCDAAPRLELRLEALLPSAFGPSSLQTAGGDDE